MNAHIQGFADALQAASPFVIAEGRNLETTIYQKRYPTFNYGAHVPVVTEGHPWSIGTTFFTVDNTGQAKFLSGSAADMPFNSAQKDMLSHDFAMIGSGWEWTMEDINQAQLYKVNLSATKAMSAASEIERLLNTIAMSGSTEKNWTGLVNNASVTATDVAADGTASSRLWTAKTADLILRDVNDLLSSIRTTTAEVEWADTLRLPPSAFRLISTKRLSTTDSDLSILDYLRKGNIYTAETGQPLDVQPLRELASAAAGGAGRMVAYRKDPEVLRFHLPMPRTVLQPRQKSIMGFETGIIARTGGTEIRLPKAIAYGDLLTAA